ncbi:hypothetical protein J9303_09785 [Bacillaceae bacterium Marseille-Q3522]|nr:hypothetical protein [Bacillaceae bacterium Marseille-Q3522]
MKIIDELFEMYRDKLVGDEEDINMLTFAFLEEMSRDDLLHIIENLDNQELYDLIGLYIIETLKEKFSDSRPFHPQMDRRKLH